MGNGLSCLKKTSCCQDDDQSTSTLQQPSMSASTLQQPSTLGKQQPTMEDCIKRFNDGKDKWEIDALVSAINDLLNNILNREKSSTRTTSSTPKTPMLLSFIQSGGTFLKSVNKHVENAAGKDIVLGAREGTHILSDILERLGNIHWILGALSIIGYLVSKFDQMSTNKAECLELLKCMVDLVNHIQKLNTQMPEEENRMRDALLIFEGCIMCASQIQSGKFFRFLKTSVDPEMLKSLCSKISYLYLDMTQLPPTLPLEQPTYPSSADVFLSHSGKQKDFVKQLYRDLTREGVSCFFDQSRESLPLGEKWAPRIVEAAETCRVAVLLLSMDFIQSRWPMLELFTFLKDKKSGKNSNLKILPLFFKLSPDDLKDFTSDPQDILDQTRREIAEKTGFKWKDISEALREVRKINGLRFNGEDEVSFRDQIIKEIRTILPPSPVVSMPVGLGKGKEIVTLRLAQPTYPSWAVGLEEPVNQITEMLEIEKLEEGAEVLVIYGFGGIGKTTLADAVVANLKLESFNYTKIEINEDPQKNYFNKIQQQLLQDVFPEYQYGQKLRNCGEGRDHLGKAFQSEPNKPVFIYIDNVLRAQDLEELLPIDLKGLSQRSRILVTARDLSVTDFLTDGGLSRRQYRVNTLKDEHGEKILCNDPVKREQIRDDVQKILKICRGIPLALKVVGAQLKKQNYRADNCSEILKALEKGEEIKQGRLTERLINFVYDRLENAAQEAFLDICSFVTYFSRRWIEYIVGGAEVAALEEAALITVVPLANSFDAIRERGVYWAGEEGLSVHDVILAKGRNMAKGMRIVDDRQSFSRAVEDRKVIKGVGFGNGFDREDESEYMLEESQLSCMSNSLRVFRLGPHMSVTRRCNNTFQELRYLGIGGNIPCLPVNFEALPSLAFYVGPIFKEGLSINKLPKSIRFFQASAQSNRDECATSEVSKPINTVRNSGLKELDLSPLINLPILLEGIDQFTELNILLMNGWDEMEELPAQVCQLRSLQKLIMVVWKSLKRLPESFSNLTGLTHLDLRFCDRLEGLCSRFGELKGLTYLALGGSKKLIELPDSFSQLIALEYLNLEWCTALTILPDNFGQLTALKYLNLSCCLGLKELPLSLGELRSLRELDLGFCLQLKELPSNFVQLTNLQVLKVHGHEELPLSLEELRSSKILG